jgi:putative MATE family efflux protein
MSENNIKQNTSTLNIEEQNIYTNNILEGSIPKTIYIVAAPTMIHMFLETSYHLIDTIWIGMLGSIALASVAASSFILWLIFSACSLAEVGVNSLVARYTGAKDHISVNKIARNGFLFGIFLAFFIAITFILSCEQLFYLMGLEPDVISNALCFILPVFVGLPIFTSTTISSAIFRGIGDTKTPLKVLSATLILNAILAPLFIFGIFFPEMGIAGGALATIICQSFAALTNIYLLKKEK